MKNNHTLVIQKIRGFKKLFCNFVTNKRFDDIYHKRRKRRECIQDDRSQVVIVVGQRCQIHKQSYFRIVFGPGGTKY